MNVKWLWISLRVSSFMLINSVSFQSCQNYSEVQQVSLCLWAILSPSQHLLLPTIFAEHPLYMTVSATGGSFCLLLGTSCLSTGSHCQCTSALLGTAFTSQNCTIGGKAGRDLSFFLILNSNLEGHHKWDSWSPMNYLADFPWSFLLSVAYRH